MAEERAIDKVVVTTAMSVEMLKALERKYRKSDKDTRTDYIARALEECVAGVHLTMDDLNYCREYSAEQYRKRMAAREKRRGKAA